MSSRAASPRVLVLAAVVAVHAGALLVLLAETRIPVVSGEADVSPLLVVWLQPREQPPSASRAAARLAGSRIRPPAAGEPELSAPQIPAAPGTAIDWVAEVAEAAAAAARQSEAAEQRVHQARALASKPNPMFAARRKRHEFHWNSASTHRVEPVPGSARSFISTSSARSSCS
ncbi:MAG TPA: hypothetical protein VEC59_07925 [Steroidobacteraceae bacterium]|nr:hypothetical protein [Steroidobacteraceae bacterium]